MYAYLLGVWKQICWAAASLSCQRDEKYCSTDKDTFSCLFEVRHDASAYTAHINFTSFAPLLSEFLHLSFFYSNNILLMLMSSLLGAKA